MGILEKMEEWTDEPGLKHFLFFSTNFSTIIPDYSHDYEKKTYTGNTGLYYLK